MSPTSDPNPYAPPATDITQDASSSEPPVKRPASVKWALAIVTLVLGAAAFAISGVVIEEGWKPFLGFYFTTGWGLVRVAALVAGVMFILGGRHIIAYGIGVLAMAAVCAVFTTVSWETEFQFHNAGSRSETIGGLLVTILQFWLFLRFTFGRPSRLYYRICKPRPT